MLRVECLHAVVLDPMCTRPCFIVHLCTAVQTEHWDCWQRKSLSSFPIAYLSPACHWAAFPSTGAWGHFFGSRTQEPSSFIPVLRLCCVWSVLETVSPLPLPRYTGRTVCRSGFHVHYTGPAEPSQTQSPEPRAPELLKAL